jgi:3-dehydroquinate dehydratase-1
MQPPDHFQLVAASTSPVVPSEVEDLADLIELRLDGCPDREGAVEAVTCSLPVIVTNRPTWEGGTFEGDESDRLAILAEAMSHEQVVAVDIELRTLQTPAGAALADQARAAGRWVIASVHDFEATPPRSECERLLRSAGLLGDVGKLAVTAETPGDAAQLLAVTDSVARWGVRVSTMAMGAVGTHTRVVAPTYGSVLGYAPAVVDSPTATGQLPLETLRAMLSQLP